jgi:hypothetical protein
MTTRRQIIRTVPALPLMTAAGAAALLTACGKKKPLEVAAPAVTPMPAPAPAAPAAPESPAATGPLVDEKDPVAVGLGYVDDTSKVDKTKYPQYVAGQACSNCSLYQGAAGSVQGGCSLFAGKQVAAKGWCNAWAKKTA